MQHLHDERPRRVALLLLVSFGLPAAADASRMLQLHPCDGVGGFAKEFQVATGVPITGVRFSCDGGEVVFPEVTLVPGPVLDARVPVRIRQNVRGPTASGSVSLLWSEAVVAVENIYHVIIRMPIEVAVEEGPRIGAIDAAEPSDSYIVAGFGTAPIAVGAELDIQLVAGAMAKVAAYGDPEREHKDAAGSRRRVTLTALTSPAGHAVAAWQLQLAVASQVEVTLHDVRGRIVRVLIPESVLAAGVHRLEWDGRNNAGSEVAVGVYFVRLETGHEQLSRKVVVH